LAKETWDIPHFQGKEEHYQRSSKECYEEDNVKHQE